MKGKRMNRSAVKISRSSISPAVIVLAAAAVAGSGTGCERRIREAIGDRNQIMVYSDEQNWALYGSELERIFQREINTPRLEYIFTLRYLTPESWQFLPRFKNLVICAPLEDLTPTAEKVRELLSPEVRRWIYQNRRAIHVVQEDPFTQKQLFLIITADTKDRLIDYLQSHRETLFTLMEERLNERVSDLIYREDEQYAIEDSLFRDMDFTVRVPWGFRTDWEYAAESFVRMIKYGPERWFFACSVPLDSLEARGLYWAHELEELGRIVEQGGDPDPSDIRRLARLSWAFRDEISRVYLDGDYVLQYATTGTIVEFRGRRAIRHYGRWQIDDPIAGGPMVAYCFIDPGTSRLWWLDGAVFYPNEPKETYLRQLDVMIQTFMTGSEARDYIATIQEKIDGRR